MPVRPIEKTLLATVKRLLSSGSPMSHFIIAEPASNCRIKPAVTIGPMPSSIRVPRLEAKITLNALKLSVADLGMPYRGISDITR